MAEESLRLTQGGLVRVPVSRTACGRSRWGASRGPDCACNCDLDIVLAVKRSTWWPSGLKAGLSKHPGYRCR